MTALWVWLADAASTSQRSAKALLERFGSADAIYDLTAEELSSLKLPRKVCERLCDKSLTQAEQTLEICRRREIQIVNCTEVHYPKRLLALPDPPVVLYMLGQRGLLETSPALSVVGTRQPSDYAKKAGENICSELSAAGIVLISGLALGCDTIAHKACLDNDTPTVAVTAGGLDRIYPPQNKELARRITKNGLIISEYPPKTPSRRENFPKRNRIVAALGEALFVIESKAVGGSLITADAARKLGRKIYFLPGSLLDDCAAGSNALAKSGGIPLCGAEDIAESFGIDLLKVSSAVTKRDFSEYNLNECQIYITQRLSAADLLPDEMICEKFGISHILANITMLEIKGLVKPLAGGRFSLK